MKNLILFSVVGMLSACGSVESEKSRLADVRTNSIDFGGKDADAVYVALTQMGVVDTDRLIGASNLHVSDLYCSKPIIVPADEKIVPSCELTLTKTDGTTEKVTKLGEHSLTMLDVLSRHGAAVNGGINATAVAAKVLHCSKPVVPNPVAHCVLETI